MLQQLPMSHPRPCSVEVTDKVPEAQQLVGHLGAIFNIRPLAATATINYRPGI